MGAEVFKGVMPALMTPCAEDGSPDFCALVRKGRALIDAGMAGLIYCGSMGDWPLLTYGERMLGVERLVEAGLPVIVGTGAQSTKQAVELAAHAKAVGAKGLMMIPRLLSRVSAQPAQFGHFDAVLEAAVDLPSVIYNSPYYGFETRADLFFQLRVRHTHLVGFKEFGGAAALSYAAEHITGQSADLSLMVGVDTMVFHGFVNCGAQGAITGIGNVLPKEVLEFVALCERAAAGDAPARSAALEYEAALMALSRFDEGADLVLYYKYLLELRGETEYRRHFNVTDALSPSQKHYARSQLDLFDAWRRTWKAPGTTSRAAALEPAN